MYLRGTVHDYYNPLSECQAIINIEWRIIKLIPFEFGLPYGVGDLMMELKTFWIDWYNHKSSQKSAVQKPEFCLCCVTLS